MIMVFAIEHFIKLFLLAQLARAKLELQIFFVIECFMCYNYENYTKNGI